MVYFSNMECVYLLLKDFYKDVNGIEDYFRKMKKEEISDWN